MNIQEDYVSFETAKLLKEKGFDIPCDNFYDSSGKTPNESVYGGANIETLDYNADPFVKSGFPKFKTFSAPTQSMAMKWLREKHNIDILITIGGFIEKGKVYFCSVYKNLINYGDLKECSTYEEACEAGVKHCLNNII